MRTGADHGTIDRNAVDADVQERANAGPDHKSGNICKKGMKWIIHGLKKNAPDFQAREAENALCSASRMIFKGASRPVQSENASAP